MSVNSINSLKSLEQLQELFTNSNELTAREYLNLLKQIKKNFAIKLAIASITDVMTQAMCYLSIIEKVHYLVDSAEPKAQAEGLGVDGNTRTCVGYEISEDEAALEKLFNADADA